MRNSPTEAIVVRELIDALASDTRGNGGYVSGEELAQRTGVSRAAIWKHIKKLRAKGYRIDALPHCGYKLISMPALLSPEQITPLLTTERLGRTIAHYQMLSSTNEFAKEFAERGEPEGCVVIAEEQTSGRGRLERAWASPPDGIWLSVILRPQAPLIEASRFTIVAAVAAAASLELLGLTPEIKWPNDILLGGKKVCGILLELNGQLGKVSYLVIGFGINVNNDLEELSPDIRGRATTLKAELGHSVNRQELVAALLAQLEHWYAKLAAGAWHDIEAAWLKRCRMLGKTVRLATLHETIEGTVTGIDGYGALRLLLPDGRPATFSAGDVTIL